MRSAMTAGCIHLALSPQWVCTSHEASMCRPSQGTYSKIASCMPDVSEVSRSDPSVPSSTYVLEASRACHEIDFE